MLEGELIPARGVEIHAMTHPLRPDVDTAVAPEGLTLEQMLGESARPHVHVWVGDVRIPRKSWRYVRPKAGAVVTVKVLASGGGGDSDKMLRTVLQIAVLALSIYVGGMGGAGYQVLGAVIGVTGQLAINALIPPQMPSPGDLMNGFDRLRSLTGTRNNFNPYGVVPRVYGKHRFYPPYAAKPYTEIVGDDQYLRVLLCLGYGPLNVTDLRIGETPLANFDDVQYEITSTPTLYRTSVAEESVSVLMANGDTFTRTTSINTKELSLDVLFHRGLEARDIEGDGDDDRAAARIKFKIEYRLAGTADPWVSVHTLPSLSAASNTRYSIQNSYTANWKGLGLDGNLALWAINPAGDIVIQEYTREAFRTGLSWQFPSAAQWEVRVRYIERQRFDVEMSGGVPVDYSWTTSFSGYPDSATDFYVTAVRSVLSQAQAFSPSFVYLAMRIRATDQLNGVVDTVNCVAESILWTWSSGGGWVQAATSNPAWAWLDVKAGSATERALAKESRFQLDEIKSWADDCAANGREYNAVIEARTTVQELARDIAAIGRANRDMRNGKFTVVRDIPNLTPVQAFSPRNSWGFSGQRQFQDLPHALRARFVNPDKAWQQDEIVVYDDGYTAANATRFELLELRGVTSATQAWRDGRYHLAVARLRQEEFRINVDVENLVCRRGDLVQLAYDVIREGLAWGRLKSIAGSVLGLDEPVTMDGGLIYSMRIRKNDGTIALQNVITAAGEQTSVTLTAPVGGLNPGDLYLFGEIDQESIACKVLRITPRQGLEAELELVPENAGVYAAELGTMPPFQSSIDSPDDGRPVAPIVYLVRSDEGVLIRASDGSLVSRIVISFGFTAATKPQTAQVETHYRLVDANVWTNAPSVPADAGEVSILPVVDGDVYELRVRTADGNGKFSDWAEVITHTVVGKTTPPPDVEKLFINGDVLTWTYPDQPLDFAGFAVRYQAGNNPSWENAIAAHVGLVAGPPFVMHDMPAGQLTILVKAIDTAGHESVSPAVILIDLGEPQTENIVVSDDVAAAGFPGTKTNCTVSGTDLIADAATLIWSGADSTALWSGGDAALLWTAAYEEMIYETSYAPPTDATGVDSKLILAPTVEGTAWAIEYRNRGSSSIWSGINANPLWSGDANLLWVEDVGPWRAWPGALTNVQRETFDFRLTVDAGTIQGKVLDYAFVVDVPDVREELQDFALAAAGARLPLTKVYRAITNVGITLQDNGGSAVVVKRVDLSPLGPLLQAYDSAGAPVSASIDARIEGY